MSLTSIDSPLRYVSYDILLDIFLYCLPEDRLDAVQPNPYLVPILFCHVCSFWRTVALSSPALWTHLHVKLPILWDSYQAPIVRDREALARKVEFMKWWRNNHGFLAPLLRVNLHRRSWIRREEHSLFGLDSSIEDFLFDYISSAQYLDVGIFYICLTGQDVKRGFSVTSFSHLHTLVSHRNHLTDDDGILGTAYQYSGDVVPSQLPTTIRRLAIENEEIKDNHTRSQLYNWAILTHLSLHSLQISLGVWFSLIRNLVHLQWGDFSVSTFGEAIEPPEVTLPSLSTLSMYCHFGSGAFPLPLSTLFQNLNLPALRTLSLSSAAPSWCDNGAITEIHNVLRSAPAVTQLFLGTHATAKAGFLCFWVPDSAMPTTIGDTGGMLLAMDAPQLTHLQVELRCTQTVDAAVLARRFVEEFFISNPWLGLASATNTIRTITIVVKNARRDTVPDFYNIVEDLLVWNIQKYVTTPTDVSFEVALADDVTGAYFDGSAWKSWGSKSDTIYDL